MKVILLEDIEKLGKKYDLKEVVDGYARNFLIPRGLAKIAEPQVLDWAAKQKELLERRAEEELERTGKLASEIDGLELEIPVKVGEQEQLFEKINSQRVSVALKEMGYDIKRTQIEMADIEDLGEFGAKIKFEHNLEAQIKIIVVEEK